MSQGDVIISRRPKLKYPFMIPALILIFETPGGFLLFCLHSPGVGYCASRLCGLFPEGIRCESIFVIHLPVADPQSEHVPV